MLYKSPESAEAELAGLENKLLSEARSSITIVSGAVTPDTEEKRGPSKTVTPIWTRTTAANSPQAGAASQRKGRATGAV